MTADTGPDDAATTRTITPIETAPWMMGPAGRAWAMPVDPGKPAVVGAWLVECPQAHPVWHSYVFSMVHLREADGVPTPLVHVPGASHEFVLYALSPDADRQAVLDTGLADVLGPPNFAAQLVATNDVAALEHARVAATLVVQGFLSPDTDDRAAWVKLFGGNMVQAASD